MLKFNKSITTFDDCIKVFEDRFEKYKEQGYMLIDTRNLDELTTMRLKKYLKMREFRLNEDYHDSFMVSWFDPLTKNNYK